MAKHYKEYGLSKRERLGRRLRPLVFVVFVAMLVGLGYFIFDIFRQSSAADTASKLSTPINSTIVSDTQIMSSQYFQFQTPDKWRAVANETRDGHYVYRQFNGQLVEQELVVDVNNQNQEVLATTHINRLLPVTATAQGGLSIANSDLEPCKKYVKKGTEKTNQLITVNKVTFPCNPDFTGYEAVVGLVNGTNIMSLPRPNGANAYYKITYRNVSANAGPRDVIGIVRSFETR